VNVPSYRVSAMDIIDVKAKVAEPASAGGRP